MVTRFARVLAILVLLPALLGAGQPPDSGGAEATFRPRFVLNEKHLFRIGAETTLGWSEPGAANSPKSVRFKQEVHVALTVIGVDDAGAVSLAGVFDLVDVHRDADGVTSGMSISGKGLVREGEKVPEGASVGAVPSGSAETDTVGTLVGAVMRIDVGADGSITALSGLEKAYEAARRYGREGDQWLGLFAPGSAKRTLESLWLVDEPAGRSPEKPGVFRSRKVGEEWTLDKARPLGERRLLFTATTFKVEGVEGTVARLSATATGTIKTDPGAGPTLPKLTIEEQSQTETVSWDTAASGLVRREIIARYKTKAALGEGHSETSSIETHVMVERRESK